MWGHRDGSTGGGALSTVKIEHEQIRNKMFLEATYLSLVLTGSSPGHQLLSLPWTRQITNRQPEKHGSSLLAGLSDSRSGPFKPFFPHSQGLFYNWETGGTSSYRTTSRD